jgi:diguanylate cyclase (GGDEF)-like protein
MNPQICFDKRVPGRGQCLIRIVSTLCSLLKFEEGFIDMQRILRRCEPRITKAKLNPALQRALSVLLLICAFTSVEAGAQYRFEQFTTSNGLPQNTVAAIIQTSDGYLWFATYDGLVRYDGVRFTIFDKGNTSGIGSNRFSTLCGDTQGTLWIGTIDQGLLRYRDGLFTSITTEQGLPENNVTKVQRSEDERMLIFTGNSQLLWTEEQTLSSHNISLWNANHSITSAAANQLHEYVDRSGRRWRLEPERLLRLQGNQHTAFEVKITPDEFLQFRYEDRAGNLWFGSKKNGVYLIEGDSLKHFAELIEPKAIMPVRIGGEDNEGHVWLFSDNKLLRYKDGQFTSYTGKDGLQSQRIRDVFCDREGSIWVGTNERGVYRLSRRFLSVYTEQQGLLEDITYPIYEDRTGNIWAGSGVGMTRIGSGKTNAYPLVLSGKSNRSEVIIGSLTDKRPKITPRCFYEDKNGNLWIGTNDGLLTLKDGKLRWQPQVVSDTYVSTIIEDRAGNLWFGTGKGLIKYQAGKTTPYTLDQGLPDSRVDMLFEDSLSKLWIGTRGGLACLADGQITSFAKTGSGVASQIRSIYEDSEGILWVGTFDSGLNRYKDGQFINYNTQTGLFNNGVFQILEDRRGNFWMSSNRGIYRISRQQLNDFADKKISVINCVAYGSQDGMPSAECNGGRQPAGVKARDGKLWFPTMGGIVVIDPEAVPYNEQPPLPTIESVKINQKTVAFKEGIQIEPFQTDLEIHYTAPSSIKAEHIHFKYKLEGLNEDWVDAGTRRSVQYSHLPPGNYTFKLIAANSDGVWTETATTMNVLMKPFFYQTRLFLAMWALIFVAAGVTIYAMRVRRLKANERRLTTVVAERTAELVERSEQLEIANKRLEQLATLDGLTNIANHRRFKEFLAQQWHYSQREQQPLSLLLMDVDYFKLYNDTYGHQGGDGCLKQIAAVLGETIKRTTDLAARYGGEEFVVILSNTDQEGAVQVAERIRVLVEALQIVHIASAVNPYVTLSIGIASTIPNQEMEAADLIAAADRALYHAKEHGRNCCRTDVDALFSDVNQLHC